MGLLKKAMLEQAEFASVLVKLFRRESESFAIQAGGSEEKIRLVHKHGVVHRNRQLDVTSMTRARYLVEIAGCASDYSLASYKFFFITAIIHTVNHPRNQALGHRDLPGPG